MAAANKKQEAQRVEPATLIAAAEYFGTRPELMAGALYGVTEAITREEAKERLQAFLKREVGR